MHSNRHELTTSFAALVGTPNSGKTTLYNWLTGSKFKTVNYPGATVEYSLGQLAAHWKNGEFKVMDTPGTYSLDAKSSDEEVTKKAIFSHPSEGPAQVIVVVLDATQLDRHLILAQQIKAAGFRMVLALTMVDQVRKAQGSLNFEILAQHFACPVVEIEGLLGKGVDKLASVIAKEMQQVKNLPHKFTAWNEAQLNQASREARELSAQVLKISQGTDFLATSKKIDRYLMHPVFGVVAFFAIMSLLFSSIYWLAAPFMDLVDGFFSSLASQVLQGREGVLWADFLGNGVITAFGAVLVFVPQIFILFFGIGILESSGYLARAASLIDRPFSSFGLSGRSFVPILSGFSCAVPAIMATRNISSARERFIASFVIPLMTCSARLPVYALLIGFLFVGKSVWLAGVALAALYIGALVIGAIAAAILNRILSKQELSYFMMELPAYRRPQWRVLIHQVVHRTMSYVKRAGPIIFVLAVIVWLGSTFPNYQEGDTQVRLETSYLGSAGKVMEPLFSPMGADWRVGVGLISAFAAREVFVSTLAVVMSLGDVEEDSLQDALLSKMSAATRADGSLLFTPASVVALVVFFMIALQCMSTVGVAAREMGSYVKASVQLVALNLGAYVLAVAIFQLWPK